jgi:hypothetical protein
VHRSRLAIDPVVLRRLYVDEGLTAAVIAKRVGCTQTTIFRRLRCLGIAARPTGPAPRRLECDSLTWTPQLAYAIGLIATDGNLSPDGRHLAIPSIDHDLLETLRNCLGLLNRITVARTASGFIYRLQWGDRAFYDWLVGIGLTPRKSLTLGPLDVPDCYFADFFRGCIDGDGSVLVYTDRYNTRTNQRYVYERLYVSLVSASHPFLEWVQRCVRRLAALEGTISVRRRAGDNPLWKLRYAKAQSVRILRWMYHAPDVPALARKRLIAAPFLVPRDRPTRRGPGRPMVVI